jgi:ELWxxDGT repeat protein
MLPTFMPRSLRGRRQRAFLPLFSSVLLTGTLAVAQPNLVKDINPGGGGSYAQDLVNVNGTIYFTALNNTYGTELWKSNGTAAGTVMVKDLAAGNASSYPQHLTAVNGALYFTAGNGLYRTNGTAAGTVLVKNFSAPPTGLENVNGTLYFAANDGTKGTELWKSNGTAAGTVLVKDLVAAGSASPSALFNANGTLYFSAAGGLYKSNGTAAGTVLVKSFATPLTQFTLLNGKVYFTDQEDLWRTDGTGAGTILLKGFPGYVNWEGEWMTAEPRQFTVSGGKLFLITTLDEGNLQLWKSDGTAAGTTLVQTLGSVSVPTVSNLADLNGMLYFAHSVGTNNESLYRTDGTTVTLVKNFGYGTPDINWLTYANGRLYFAAGIDPWYEGPYGHPSRVELWTSDGTTEGTYLVADINPDLGGGEDPSEGGSYPMWLVDAKGVIYFTADNGTVGRELWTYTTPNAVVPALRLNAGGGAYHTPTGEPFSADAFFSGGSTGRLKTPVDFANTEADTLYQTERWGTFSYKLPVENGSYQVVLHFAESYWGYSRPGGVGSRRFNVDIEGRRQLTEFDIFAKAGGALKATQEILNAEVTDGILNIDFLRGSANYPKVSAIQVLPAGATFRAENAAARTAAAAGELSTEAWQARVHPNPVADRLTVQLPFGVEGVQATAVADALGNVLLQNAHRPAGTDQLQIATGGLPKGIYLLRLRTDQGSRVVRFVKQ